jgi:hypothetical protein
MSAAELERFEDGLNRCQRIRDKDDQIKAEIEFNRRRIRKEWGFDVPDETVVVDEGELEAMLAKNVKKVEDAFKEIDAANAIRKRRRVRVKDQ